MLRRILRRSGRHLAERALDRQIPAWLRTLPELDLDLTGQRLVFNTTRATRSNVHLFSDLCMAHLVARQGGEAHVLLDDGLLEHWDTVQMFRKPASALSPMRNADTRRAAMAEAAAVQRLFEIEGLHLHWYSALVEDISDIATDRTIERYAIESTLRYFEAGRFEPNDRGHRDYFDLSVTNAKVSRAIGAAAAHELDATSYLSSHGVYSTWGPAYREAGAHGLPTLVYAIHPYRARGLFIVDSPAGSMDHERLDHYLEHAPFPDQARATAKAYLDSRFNRTTQDAKLYYSHIAEGATLPAGTSAHGYRYTLGMFPNVVWDAIGDHVGSIFDGVLDWIATVVREIAKHPDIRLIIRLHPAEVGTYMKGTRSTIELVEAEVPELRQLPNVQLVLADEPVDSYRLLREEVDVALIYTGTLGGEAPMLDTPVVACAKGRFSSRFVHTAQTREAYLEVLADPGDVVEDFNARRESIQEQVLKYQHFVAYEIYYRCPMLSQAGRVVVKAEELRDPDSRRPEDLTRLLRRICHNGKSSVEVAS